MNAEAFEAAMGDQAVRGSSGIQPDIDIFCGDYTALDGHNNYHADPHEAVVEI